MEPTKRYGHWTNYVMDDGRTPERAGDVVAVVSLQAHTTVGYTREAGHTVSPEP